MSELVNDWINGLMNEWMIKMDGWMNTYEWMDACINRWINSWVNGWMEGRIDGWMN